MRAALVRRAIEAGKHVYCEKPIADQPDDALSIARWPKAGVKNGVVQDKLFLPGMLKLKGSVDSGFFGRMFAVRGEFGYWVFEGDRQAAQRPSWNYRSGRRRRHHRSICSVIGATCSTTLRRGDEPEVHRCDTHPRALSTRTGKRYRGTAEDAAYATFMLEGDVVANINSSWPMRVYRDELVTFQVDGTQGSAVAGLRELQDPAAHDTPRPMWNPTKSRTFDFRAGWQEVPDNGSIQRLQEQWEMFLRHVARIRHGIIRLLEGAKGVQLAELALRAGSEGVDGRAAAVARRQAARPKVAHAI